MRSTFTLAAVAVVLLVAVGVAGCAGKTTTTTQVTVTDSGFSPAESSVKVGDTVTWTNGGGTAHTVTWGDTDSGAVYQGETYSFTFEEAGTYKYFCRYHTSETGELEVR